MRDVHRDLEKMRLLIRQKVQQTGLTQTEIDRRCGWTTGSLSRLLNGRNPLRVESILIVLDALNVEPGRFFAELYGSGGAANAYRHPQANETVH